jgi:hypothetical protein
MFENAYEGAAGKSSSGDKAQFRKGSRDAYKKDMYDAMPSMAPKGPANATGTPNTGIQGSKGSSDSLDGPKTGKGQTGDKSQKVTVSANDGSKDYGKGNPFKKGGITSIAQLKDLAKKKGGY